MRHTVSRDANHKEIEDVFRRMLADKVTDCSMFGGGFGDLFVSFCGVARVIEIKKDETARLKPSQVKFKRVHGDVWVRIDTVEDAIECCNAIRRLATPRY